MKAGSLDRRIDIIQLQASPVSDQYGQPVTTETIIATVWAQIQYQPAKEFLREGTTTSEQVAVFTIRWRDDVTTNHRIWYQDQTWDITSVVEIGRKRGLELHATLRK